jgi:hypothetical protein
VARGALVVVFLFVVVLFICLLVGAQIIVIIASFPLLLVAIVVLLGKVLIAESKFASEFVVAHEIAFASGGRRDDVPLDHEMGLSILAPAPFAVAPWPAGSPQPYEAQRRQTAGR